MWWGLRRGVLMPLRELEAEGYVLLSCTGLDFWPLHSWIQIMIHAHVLLTSAATSPWTTTLLSSASSLVWICSIVVRVREATTTCGGWFWVGNPKLKISKKLSFRLTASQNLFFYIWVLGCQQDLLLKLDPKIKKISHDEAVKLPAYVDQKKLVLQIIFGEICFSN